MILRNITKEEKATKNPEKTKVLEIRGLEILLDNKELNEIRDIVVNNNDLFIVSESAITEIDKRTHDYNHKIDVAGNTNEQNTIAEAKRDALDEALTIIRKHSR